MSDACNNVGKGSAIVRIYTGGSWQDFGVEEAEVVRKLNYGWKTAQLQTTGYSLPLVKADECSIVFGNPNTTITRFLGYVDEISEVKSGRDITYTYELYGKEAFINYRLFQPGTTILNAGTLIQDMMSSIGYGYVIASTLYNTTIALDSTRKDYVYNYLRELNEKHTINFYFDNGGTTIHAFYGNDNTLSNTIKLPFERDKNSAISNVFNRVALYTDMRVINDTPDYPTDTASDLGRWHFKRLLRKQGGIAGWDPGRTYDDPEDHPELNANCVAGTRSVYVNIGTIPIGDSAGASFSYESRAYYVCDLGEEFAINTLTYLNYKVSFRDGLDSSQYGGPVVYNIKTEFLTTPDYPPEEAPDNSAIKSDGWLSTSSGAWTINGDDWHTINTKIPSMVAASKQYTLSTVRYIGISAMARFPWYSSPTPAGTTPSRTVRVYIDDMNLCTGVWDIFTDTLSSALYGLREYKPDNAGYVIARSSAELHNKCLSLITPRAQSEESLRKLSFPGSLNIEVGMVATIRSDESTIIYDVKEVTDRQTNGQWIQEIKVSSSPINIPKTNLGNKLAYMDNRLKDVNFALLNDAYINTNVQPAVDYTNTNEYYNKDIQFNFTCNTYTPQQVIDAIYGWTGNSWTPTGFTNIVNALYFKDINTNQYVKQFPILIDHGGSIADPAIVWDQAFINKKDITAGGFIGSNQGAVGLGHGLYYAIENPHMWLIHGTLGWDCLDIKYWDTGSETIPAATLNGTVYDATTIGWGKEYYGKIRSGAFITSRDYPTQNRYLTMLHDGTNGSIICNYGNLAFSVPSGSITGLSFTFDTLTVGYGVTITNTAAFVQFNDISVYRQTSPSTVLEISGAGLIVDGAINCDTINGTNYSLIKGTMSLIGNATVSATIKTQVMTNYGANGITFNTNIIPLTDAGFDNGFSGYKWNRVYSATIISGNVWCNTLLYSTGSNGTISLPGKATVGTMWADTYQNLPVASTITLSNVGINTDKDWQTYSISNLGSLQLKLINGSGASGLTIANHVTPSADASYDMGLSGTKWNRVYTATLITNNIWANTIFYSNGTAGTISIPGRATIGTIYANTYQNLPSTGGGSTSLSLVTIDTAKDWQAYNITNVGTLQVKYINGVGTNLTFATHIIPPSDVGADCGIAGTKWNRMYSATVITGNIWASTILYADGNPGTVSIPGRATIGTIYANSYLNIPASSGSTSLSLITIDTAKDWGAYNITNVGTLQVKYINGVGTNLTFATHIIPASDVGADCGISGTKWNRVYSATVITNNVWCNTIINSGGTSGTVAIPGRATIGTLYVGTYGNLPAAAAVSISAVSIDATKDWNGKGITNLGTLVGQAASLSSWLYGNSISAEYVGVATSIGIQGTLKVNKIVPYSGNTVGFDTISVSVGTFSSSVSITGNCTIGGACNIANGLSVTGNIGTSGNIDASLNQVNCGNLYANGSNAAIWMANRSNTINKWAWYVDGNSMKMWNGAADILIMSSIGVLNVNSNSLLVSGPILSTNGSLFLTANATISTAANGNLYLSSASNTIYTNDVIYKSYITNAAANDFAIGSGYELDGTAHASGGYKLYFRWGNNGNGGDGWDLVFGSAAYPILTLNSGGATIGGNLSANGQLISKAAGAGLCFENRSDSSKQYQWYSLSNIAYLWHTDGGNLITVNSGGAMNVLGSLSVTGEIGATDTIKISNNKSIFFKDTDGGDGFRMHESSSNNSYLDMGSSGVLYIRGTDGGNSGVVCPPGSNGINFGGDGSSYGYWASVWAYYLRYKSGGLATFDVYDDLEIAKLWGEEIKLIDKEKYGEGKLLPPEDDPFAIVKSETGDFIDQGKFDGFLLGCIKQLTIERDTQRNINLELMNSFDVMTSQIGSLTTLLAEIQKTIGKGTIVP